MQESSSNKTESVIYRPYKEEDRNFILASWLRGMYYGDAGYIKHIPKDIFMGAYHRVLEQLLTRQDTFVRVACLQDDPDTILGYAVLGAHGETVYIHWVFVKTPFRNIGIARSLVPITASACTHLSKVGVSILKNHSELIFNPFVP